MLIQLYLYRRRTEEMFSTLSRVRRQKDKYTYTNTGRFSLVVNKMNQKQNIGATLYGFWNIQVLRSQNKSRDVEKQQKSILWWRITLSRSLHGTLYYHKPPEGLSLISALLVAFIANSHHNWRILFSVFTVNQHTYASIHSPHKVNTI